MRLALTERFCTSAKSINAAQTDFFDEVATGLALRVSTTGHKGWTFNFTSLEGKRARMGLGTYPATTLAAARARAMEARGMVEAGEDPRPAFGAQAAGAMTVAGLVESYLAKHAQPNLRSGAEVARRLRKNVEPVIGNVRLADLHRRDINRVIDAIIKRGRPVEANRVFEDVRGMLRWAAARGDLDRNPAEGMGKPAAPRTRERALSPDEIATLWHRLPQALARSEPCQRIIKLCLVTAQRVGEVAGMRRDELDLQKRVWRLPGSRTKNGYAHVVPLSALALNIIEGAVADADGSPFIFPSGDRPLPAMAVAKTIGRAQERIGIPHWSIHDLRRTALTGMASLGIAPIVLGHVANHRTTTKAGITLAVYSKYEYEAEKRQALDLWAARLEAIIGDGAAEIVPLEARRA
jgi:integrase